MMINGRMLLLENKKKVLFISLYERNKRENDGVAKKIASQIKTLEILGFEVNYTFVYDGKLYLMSNDSSVFMFNSSGTAYIDTYKLYNILRKLVVSRQIGVITYVYIRKTFTNFALSNFLRTTKLLGIKNIIEIPVYPYKDEKIKTIKSAIAFYLDILLNYAFFKAYVDLIVNYNGYNKIFRTQSISINNGILIDEITLNNKQFDEKEINIGTVSSMAYWHGYDRVIEGLKQYSANNQEPEVFLHLVGEGPEIEHYKQLCNNYNLNDKVFFYGQAGGAELDHLYNKFDLGIGALGIFRKGLDNVSSIKVPELCARGIPFVYAGSEEGINSREVFALKVPNDNTPVDIKQIVYFYDKIKRKKNIRYKMREVANKRFSWVTQFQSIFNLMQ